FARFGFLNLSFGAAKASLGREGSLFCLDNFSSRLPDQLFVLLQLDLQFRNKEQGEQIAFMDNVSDIHVYFFNIASNLGEDGGLLERFDVVGGLSNRILQRFLRGSNCRDRRLLCGRWTGRGRRYAR